MIKKNLLYVLPLINSSFSPEFFLRLICYDFESNSTLEDFLSEKGVVIDLDAVCAVAFDVITAIEYLLDHGIAHNNITTGNILIRQCPRVSRLLMF